MKTLIAAGILALSVAPLASTVVRAEDFGQAIARDAIRGAVGGPAYGYRDGYRDDYRRDRYRDRDEGRSAYGGDCRTVTIERDDGSDEAHSTLRLT